MQGQALYSVGTYDVEIEAYTPQEGLSVPAFNITVGQLRQALRELRERGYSAYRVRDTDGSYDSDSFVLIERTDGELPDSILERWKR